MDKNEKIKLIKKYESKSPLIKNFIMSFLFGGTICLLGEFIKRGLIYLEISSDDARALTTVILIFIASVLTGLGIFDKIARHAGAGTLVPVTGFSNAVTSQAMDSGSEGIILGVGAIIFTIAGPVILFGITAGVIYGIIYYLFSLFIA
jgi:stage V sporulation protein AC